MATQILTIGSIAIDYAELKENQAFPLKRVLERAPMEEMEIGRTKNGSVLSIQSGESIWKWDLVLVLDQLKTQSFFELFNNQDISEPYYFSSPLTIRSNYTYCSIKSLEIVNSYYRDSDIYYEIALTLLEY